LYKKPIPKINQARFELVVKNLSRLIKFYRVNFFYIQLKTHLELGFEPYIFQIMLELLYWSCCIEELDCVGNNEAEEEHLASRMKGKLWVCLAVW
jgi:hypothetical protein